MTHDEKLNLIINLDEELLKGGVALSEWATFLIRDVLFTMQIYHV